MRHNVDSRVLIRRRGPRRVAQVVHAVHTVTRPQTRVVGQPLQLAAQVHLPPTRALVMVHQRTDVNRHTRALRLQRPDVFKERRPGVVPVLPVLITAPAQRPRPCGVEKTRTAGNALRHVDPKHHRHKPVHLTSVAGLLPRLNMAHRAQIIAEHKVHAPPYQYVTVQQQKALRENIPQRLHTEHVLRTAPTAPAAATHTPVLVGECT